MSSGNPVDVAAMDPWDSTCLGIGYYVAAFSQMEFFLALILSRLLNLDYKTVQFMWRDVGIKQKVATIRRAANETIGDSDREWHGLRQLLKDVDGHIPFRNDLMHGTYFDGHGGPSVSRIGANLKSMHAADKPLSYETLVAECAAISALSRQLGDWAWKFKRPFSK